MFEIRRNTYTCDNVFPPSAPATKRVTRFCDAISPTEPEPQGHSGLRSGPSSPAPVTRLGAQPLTISDIMDSHRACRAVLVESQCHLLRREFSGQKSLSFHDTIEQTSLLLACRKNAEREQPGLKDILVSTNATIVWKDNGRPILRSDNNDQVTSPPCSPSCDTSASDSGPAGPTHPCRTSTSGDSHEDWYRAFVTLHKIIQRRQKHDNVTHKDKAPSGFITEEQLSAHPEKDTLKSHFRIVAAQHTNPIFVSGDDLSWVDGCPKVFVFEAACDERIEAEQSLIRLCANLLSYGEEVAAFPEDITECFESLVNANGLLWLYRMSSGQQQQD
ncbi:hypothetical protein NM208_g13102 [Fusarium decemcellulare]|uniref:Uncharacterized protein n=1 Tax=Fusarium decemcellulare TaxID=57161 RepID=A0ACC1RL51_9HYPO|nr:hypothetical protein NM208_g13102 [Fusarium decemcellulare]